MGSKETKRERFEKVAEARTNKIIDMLRLLSNCSSTASYEYTDADVKQIFGAIERETRNAKAKFDGRGAKKEKKFSLKK